MANPLGTFDPTAVPDGWFDETRQPIGWFDRDLLDVASSGGSYTLTCDAGAYTIAGQDADLRKSRIVVGDAGAYSLAGQDADLRKSKVLQGDAGAYVLAGQDATLTYTPVGGYTLTCDAGAFVIGGQDATLTFSGGLQDTHDGFWARQWKKIREREKKKALIEEIEEIEEQIEEVKAAVITVKAIEKAKQLPPVDYAGQQAQILRALIERRAQLMEQEDEELLLLL